MISSILQRMRETPVSSCEKNFLLEVAKDGKIDLFQHLLPGFVGGTKIGRQGMDGYQRLVSQLWVRLGLLSGPGHIVKLVTQFLTPGDTGKNKSPCPSKCHGD